MDKPNQPKVNIRLLSVKALSDINRNNAYANLTLQKYITNNKLDDLDRRFFTELVYGTLRRLNYLDAIIEHLTKRKIKKLSSMVVEILRIGIYQIIYMDKVPESAAVNEMVNISKKLTKGLNSFVNAILRNVIRRREELTIDQLSHNQEEKISYLYNQPQWLITMWIKEFGVAEIESLCAWFNETPTLTARINELKTTIEIEEEAFKKAQWDISKSSKLKEAIYINSHKGSLDKSSFLEQGRITIMDEASMVVSHVVDPQEGELILDCCAAPGSKTLHLATLMKNNGRIIAGDIHEHKINLINENANRLGVSIIEAQQHDATNLPECYESKFDRVLVDAPCSGLGILQKKLDMRWRKKEAEVNRLPDLQLQILESAAKTVKADGILVYSTCTINKRENIDVIDTFLKTHKEFSLEDAKPYIPFPLETKEKTVQLLPHRDHMDGFFIARLHKDKK